MNTLEDDKKALTGKIATLEAELQTTREQEAPELQRLSERMQMLDKQLHAVIKKHPHGDRSICSLNL